MSDEKDKDKGAAVDTKGTDAAANATATAEKGNDTKEKGKDDASAGKTKEYFEEQGAKSKSNKANGGDEVKVSLTNKTLVRFTKDHGHIKKGHEQEVSDVALAIYEKAKVVEKI